MQDREAWDSKYSRIALEDSVQRVRDVEYLKIAKILQKFIKPSSLVLEAGSGTGCILNYLVMVTGAKGYGIDSSMEANKLAHATAITLGLSCTFVSGDITRMPFPADTFDVVFSDSVIEHLATPELAILEMAWVTKLGGVVIVTTPNRLRPDGWDLYRVLYKPSYLQRSFTPWHLKNMFKHAGISVERFFGDTIFLFRNFRPKFSGKSYAKQTSQRKPGRGLYRKLEQVAGIFIPPYFWVNIGVIGRKEQKRC